MEDFRTEEDTRRPRRGEWEQRNQYTEDWGFVRVEEEMRKDNAEALGSLRCAGEEGFTTEDTKGTEDDKVKNCKRRRLR